MARLQLRQLEKTYGNAVKVLHGINLDVTDGEFMVLVGPSGCAKSTTLRMIAGLEQISAGEIRIAERVVNHLPPGKRSIAMVFQNYALFPHMKVRSNLSFGLRIQHTPREEIAQAIDEVARILEIEPLLDRLPKQLSGGQAQRVALGRALIRKPEVFLFDEPLSNLDAKLRASMRVRIKDLHRRLRQEGKPATVIYVTHDQTEAMTMGDRICVMSEGRIMQVADPKTIYQRPENLFVAGFIGSPEMNFLNGQLTGEDAPIFSFGDQMVRFDERLASRLSHDAAKNVKLGVRPQHLRVHSRADDSTISGHLSHVEFMGHEVVLYVDIDTDRVISIIDAAEYEQLSLTADQIHLRPDPENIHIFDLSNGRNISLPQNTSD